MANCKSVMAVIRAARPTFRNNYDKIVFSVHSSFLASGYVLTATGPSAFSDDALSSPSTDEVGIDHWNEHDDEYAFVYVNAESSKKVLVKCLVMNGKLLVDALADGAPEPVHLEIDVDKYVAENGGTNYSEHYKNLENLVKCLNSEILSKLDASPKPSSSSNLTRSEPPDQESRHNVNEPGFGFGFVDPSGRHIHPSGVVVPPVYPPGGDTDRFPRVGGDRDLYPGPGAGIYPRGDFGTGGDMLVGPNDPRWFGGSDGRPGFFGGRSGVPPGARFDPYGPPDVPGLEPNRFIRNPRRPPGGIHPDLEHLNDGSDFI
ncbi:Proteasome inhibitor-related [Tripterygium wilfordii]|uniref:Proteasome inhibitor-related n=1 Tax=Tripterygium wilfordii TaxID=458696 RepID=A0A7J7CTH6_TRIWF|nr:probable proteasome inhibitor [Tripterygium wilfordii]KAF5737196.1 Proteasome inhibitor-related [Tripterygium wilfordii]